MQEEMRRQPGRTPSKRGHRARTSLSAIRCSRSEESRRPEREPSPSSSSKALRVGRLRCGRRARAVFIGANDVRPPVRGAMYADARVAMSSVSSAAKIFIVTKLVDYGVAVGRLGTRHARNHWSSLMNGANVGGARGKDERGVYKLGCLRAWGGLSVDDARHLGTTGVSGRMR